MHALWCVCSYAVCVVHVVAVPIVQFVVLSVWHQGKEPGELALYRSRRPAKQGLTDFQPNKEEETSQTKREIERDRETERERERQSCIARLANLVCTRIC